MGIGSSKLLKKCCIESSLTYQGLDPTRTEQQSSVLACKVRVHGNNMVLLYIIGTTCSGYMIQCTVYVNIYEKDKSKI